MLLGRLDYFSAVTGAEPVSHANTIAVQNLLLTTDRSWI